MVKNLVLLSVSLLACAAQAKADDPYLSYIRSAPEFRPVRQDRDLLIGQEAKINLEFPATVHDVVNERTGQRLGDGRRFAFDFNTVEAVLISFRGPSP